MSGGLEKKLGGEEEIEETSLEEECVEREEGKVAEVKDKVGKKIKNEVEGAYLKRDTEYYRSTTYVKADLESFAKKLGEEKTVFDLNTNNIKNLKITCSNGGKKVSGQKYLTWAGAALGLAKTVTEAKMIMPAVLKKLLEIGVYEKQGIEYYQNAGYIKTDLEAFAKELGKEKTVFDLNTNNIKNLKITCSNGEKKVNGNRYLRGAGIALGSAKNSKEVVSTQPTILKKLLKIAGYEERGIEYYRNAKYIKADLEAFAKELGEEKTVFDLHTGNILSLKITCSNGEKKVIGRGYLKEAGVALGLTKNSKEVVSTQSTILKKLLKIAGYEERGMEYYRNAKYIKADLEAFAKELGEEKTVFDLNTDNMQDLKITCSNGEKEVTGREYLTGTSVALGLAKNREEAIHKRMVVTLKELLKIGRYEERGPEYYRNAEYVKADLEAFAKELGEEKTVFDLNTNNILNLKITCLNGEKKVGGNNYLGQAGTALGLAETVKEAINKKMVTILKELLKIAEYEERGPEYYRNVDYVKADLEVFAKELGEKKTVFDLNTVSMAGLKITCSNGEKEVGGRGYLVWAGVALGLAENHEKAKCIMAGILRELLKIAGYDVEEYLSKSTRIAQQISGLNKRLAEDKELIEECRKIAITLGQDVLEQFILAKHPELKDDPVVVKQVRLSLRGVLGQTDDDFTVPPIPDMDMLSEEVFIKVPASKDLAFAMLRDRYSDAMEDGEFADEKAVIEDLGMKIQNASSDVHKEVYGKARDLFWKVDNFEIPEDFIDYIEEDKSFPSRQQKMAAVLIGMKKRFLLAEKVGRGKTMSSILGKVTLDEERREKDPKAKPMKGIVICPKKMISTWEERLAGPEVDERGRPACYFKQNKKPKITVLDSKRSRNGEWDKVNDAEWTIVNYEMLSEKLVERLMKHNFEYNIEDEVHNVKRPGGLWSRMLRKLSLKHEGLKKGYGVYLSGTPAPNKIVQDLPAIIKFLQPDEQGSIKEIRRQLKRSNGAMIGLTLRPNMLRSKRAEIDKDLPTLHDPIIMGNKGIIYYDLDEEERSWYELVRESPLSDFKVKKKKKPKKKKKSKGKERKGSGAMEKIDTLNRICLSLQYAGEPRERISSKYRVLKETLMESLPDHNNVVIVEPRFAEGITEEFDEAFLASKDNISIYERLKEDPDFNNEDVQINFYRIDGTKRKDELNREAIIKKLHAQTDKRILNVILATAACMNEGIDMTFSDKQIWMRFPWNVAWYEQPVGRKHRPGQKNEVDVDILIARNTIEEVQLKIALAKQKLIDEVFEGKLLTDEQWEDLAKDFSVFKRSYLQTCLQSDEQFLKHCMDMMKGHGPKALKSFFERYDHARIFAELYEKMFDKSYAGDNMRFLVNKLWPLLEEKGLIKEGCKAADLGCGLMHLKRLIPDLDVFNIDLNQVSLEIAKRQAEEGGIEISDKNIQCGSFDKIDLPDKSRDLAISSLSFDFTNNKKVYRGQKTEDVNSVKTLAEWNRILKEGGVLILLLPAKKLVGKQFKRFRQEMKNFGFEAVHEFTGVGSSAGVNQNLDLKHNEKQTDFRNVVLTLRKVGNPDLSKVKRENLNFSLLRVKGKEEEKGIKDEGLKNVNVKSVYKHDNFVLKTVEEAEMEDISTQTQEDIDKGVEDNSEDGTNGDIAKIIGKIEKKLKVGRNIDVINVKKMLREKFGYVIECLKKHERGSVELEPGKVKVEEDGVIYFKTKNRERIFRAVRQ